jgi:hypothetical protein
MGIVTRVDVNAIRDGLVTAVTCSHVTQGAQNMVNARMEHVCVPKAGMGNTAPYVSCEFWLNVLVCDSSITTIFD